MCLLQKKKVKIVEYKSQEIDYIERLNTGNVRKLKAV